MRLLATSLLMMVSGSALASPLNPWGPTVGKGVVALTPFLYVDQEPLFYPYVYGQYGVTDSFELLGGVGATLGSESSFDSVELSPRYFFVESTAAVLHATWANGGGVTLAPEVHGTYELGPVTLTVNGGWGPTIDGDGFSAGSIYALVAPEYYLTENTSLFVEINPEYSLGAGGFSDAFYAEVVPGVSTGFADTHYLAFGVALPVAPGFDASGIYGGMWYSIAFGGADE